MEQLEKGIGGFVRPKNKFDGQVESTQDSCKDSNDLQCRYTGREESTREEVGCGGNENVKMDEWITDLNRIRNERIRGTKEVGEISKKVQESRLKWHGHALRREDEYYYVGKGEVVVEVSGGK